MYSYDLYLQIMFFIIFVNQYDIIRMEEHNLQQLMQRIGWSNPSYHSS